MEHFSFALFDVMRGKSHLSGAMKDRSHKEMVSLSAPMFLYASKPISLGRPYDF